jgi:hypothetical protein
MNNTDVTISAFKQSVSRLGVDLNDVFMRLRVPDEEATEVRMVSGPSFVYSM